MENSDELYELIQRCESCSSCPFESMLTINQRQKSVLKNPIPRRHIHRELIEQSCGQQYDQRCEMKYAVERVDCDDRTAAQNACVLMYSFDLGKKFGRPVSYDESSRYWNLSINSNGQRTKSKSERYAKIWNLGQRNGNFDKDGNRIKRQSLSVLRIYEIVVSPEETYEMALEVERRLLEEHKKRDTVEMLVA